MSKAKESTMRFFVGTMQFRIKGEILDANGDLKSKVDTGFVANIHAQHGMTDLDFLSGWVIRVINGHEMTFGTYEDQLVPALTQLVTRATDKEDKLYDRLREILTSRTTSGPKE